MPPGLNWVDSRVRAGAQTPCRASPPPSGAGVFLLSSLVAGSLPPPKGRGKIERFPYWYLWRIKIIKRVENRLYRELLIFPLFLLRC